MLFTFSLTLGQADNINTVFFCIRYIQRKMPPKKGAAKGGKKGKGGKKSGSSKGPTIIGKY